jgi:hypothetical protein
MVIPTKSAPFELLALMAAMLHRSETDDMKLSTRQGSRDDINRHLSVSLTRNNLDSETALPCVGRSKFLP